MNAHVSKAEAARSLDAKLERAQALRVMLDAKNHKYTKQQCEEVRHNLLKLIETLETERTRIDDEWLEPIAKLPPLTFADNWINDLEQRINKIRGKVGHTQNVTEKSIVEKLYAAPNFKNALFEAMTGDEDELKQFGEEGDEELIDEFLDKLFSVVDPDIIRWQQNAMWIIIRGAMRGQHHALVMKLINDKRLTVDSDHYRDIEYVVTETIELKQLDFFNMLMESRIGDIFRRNTDKQQFKRYVMRWFFDPASAALRDIDRQWGKNSEGGQRTRQRRATRKRRETRSTRKRRETRSTRQRN